MPKILVLCSKTGGGHVSLAEALRDQLAQDFTVEIADPQPRMIHWHYRLVSRHALWLWAAEFKGGDTPARSLMVHQASAALFAPNLARLLRRSLPDETLGRLGLRPDRFTVFLQGGGEGAAGIARSVENLLPVPGIQIMLAAGTHKALAERFATVSNLRAVAFTKEVAPLMAAAD